MSCADVVCLQQYAKESRGWPHQPRESLLRYVPKQRAWLWNDISRKQDISSSCGEGQWDSLWDSRAFLLTVFQGQPLWLELALEQSTGKAAASAQQKWSLAMQSNSRPKTVFSFSMTSLATAANPVAVSHRARGPSHFSVWKGRKEKPTELGKPPRENLLGW